MQQTPNDGPNQKLNQPQKLSWLKRPILLPLWLFVLILFFVAVIGYEIGETATQSNAVTVISTITATATPIPSTPAPSSTPSPTPRPKTWQTTHTFTGNGANKTSPFTISGDSWKLLWKCDPTSFSLGSYNVQVDVDAPGADLPVDSGAVNTICKSGNTSGITQEYQGGTFYLDINSEAAWTIDIQELK